jgi:hypothetical protein
VGPISADPDEVDTIPVLLARFGETKAVESIRTALTNPDITVATVCGGSLALAMAGLIEGRRAATHHLGMDFLDATGVIAVAARVVDDGDLVSCGAVTSGHPGGGVSVLPGTWDVTIKTPIGSLAVVYTFTETVAAQSGSATLKDETVPLRDLAVDGTPATWRQSVTKPLRLTLDFDVVIDGDRMTGLSRAGRLPRSTVTGIRRRGAIS